MPIIAVVNQKGGTGKTTIATNLACAFADGFRVLLLDADTQGSAQDWADNRVQHQTPPEVRGVEPGRLLRDARLLAPGYDWVIIDGPPGTTRASAEAVRAADLVLIPAKPSPFDVWAVSEIVAAVKARQETAAGSPKAAFVITMSKTRSRLSQQIEAALDEYGLPVLQARTTDRVAYPQAVIEGKSVLEGRDRTARNEIFALRDEIERLFDDP
jgi:chromosome partitioning protein